MTWGREDHCYYDTLGSSTEGSDWRGSRRGTRGGGGWAVGKRWSWDVGKPIAEHPHPLRGEAEQRRGGGRWHGEQGGGRGRGMGDQEGVEGICTHWDPPMQCQEVETLSVGQGWGGGGKRITAGALVDWQFRERTEANRSRPRKRGKGMSLKDPRCAGWVRGIRVSWWPSAQTGGAEGAWASLSSRAHGRPRAPHSEKAGEQLPRRDNHPPVGLSVSEHWSSPRGTETSWEKGRCQSGT